MSRVLPLVLLVSLLTGALGPRVYTASALSAAQIDQLLTSPDRHVRSSDLRIERLFAEGLRRSSTFSELVIALNRTDVIVYVEPSMSLPTTVAGRTRLALGTHHQRYARIDIRMDLPSRDLIGLIGHELRHALEIADAPSVVDDASMIRLYRSIGEPGDRFNHYDTAAARAAERQVRIEL